MFAGKHGLITPRDLFKWATRGAITYAELAANGFMLLGERLRAAEERATVLTVLQSVMKVQVCPSASKPFKAWHCGCDSWLTLPYNLHLYLDIPETPILLCCSWIPSSCTMEWSLIPCNSCSSKLIRCLQPATQLLISRHSFPLFLGLCGLLA